MHHSCLDHAQAAVVARPGVAEPIAYPCYLRRLSSPVRERPDTMRYAR
jgi:hypothetical protein